VAEDPWSLAVPAFKPEEALQRLRRDLRELGLAEREGRFERRGLSIARAAVDGTVIAAAVVRRPSQSSPEWQPKTLKSSAEVRDFTAALKKKLAEWSDRDDG
jgi:hypothetical protein